MAKSEKVRFYELLYGKDNSIQVSYAVTVGKKNLRTDYIFKVQRKECK